MTLAMTTVNLTPALVMGVILIVAIATRASPKTIAFFGICFGVAIASSMIGRSVDTINDGTTRFAGEGINTVGAELGGGGKTVTPADPGR